MTVSNDLYQRVKGFLSVQGYQDIIQWAVKNINYSLDITAQGNNFDLQRYPYQKDVLASLGTLMGRKKVIMMCCQQMR